MSRLGSFGSILAMAALVALPLAAEPDPAPAPGATAPALSRQEAIGEALAHNPALLAARQQVAQARAQVAIATALPDADFGVTTLGQNRLTSPGSRDEVDLDLGLTLPFPGKTNLRRKAATGDLRAAEFGVTQLEQQIASDAAQAYDALLVAFRHRDDLEQARQYAEEFLTRTKARFAGGTVAKIDIVKADVDLGQAQNDLIAIGRTIAAARATLNRVLGRPGGAPLTTADALAAPGELPPVESLEELAIGARPEIQGLAAQQAGARAATRLAKQFWLPDFSVTAERDAVAGSPATYATGLSIGLPIFYWQHRRGEVALASHREEELAAALTDLRAQVSLEVRTQYTSAATATQQAVFLRDQVLPEAREVYRVTSVSYKLGGASALELLDAKRTLLDAESQYVDALGAANDARAALELAVGAPIPAAPAGAQP